MNVRENLWPIIRLVKILTLPSRIGLKFISHIAKGNFFRRIKKKVRIYKVLKTLIKFIRRFKKTPLELLFGYKLIRPTEKVTIYCGVAGIWGVPFIDGTRRVASYFIEHLGQLQNSKFRIENVVWDSKTFVVENRNKKSNRSFLRRRIEWNPKKSDFLFLQTMEAVSQIRESKITKLNEKIKIVTFVHDILPILEPQWFTKEIVENFEKNLEFTIYNSILLIVSSKTVENDLHKLSLAKNLEVTFPKVERIDISSVSKNFTSSEEILKNKNLKKPLVILLISTIEPRKGYDELVEAASRALNEGANLKFIIVGRLGWVTDAFYSKFINFNKTFTNNVLWFKNLNDDEIAALIPTIDIFLSPSRGEGFGIPVTEALLAGIPTIVRDIPVYNELYNAYVAFYGPNNDFPDLYDTFINIEEIQKIAVAKIKNFSPTESQSSINSLIGVFSSN